MQKNHEYIDEFDDNYNVGDNLDSIEEIKINTAPLSEKEYRAIPIDSSSSLKEFADDRRKYYKKYVLKEEIQEQEEEEEKESKASITGRIVETLLFEGQEEFDKRFHLSSLEKIPSGKMLDFCDSLVRLTIDNTDEEGNLTCSFEEMATQARIEAKFDWKLDVILKNFKDKGGEIYYSEMLKVKKDNLTIIDLNHYNNGEKVVNSLKINEFTSPIFNRTSSENYEVYKQLKIVGFDIDDLEMKAMLDYVIIDHKNKVILPYDLKVVWNVEQFHSSYYLYRKAYIQAYVYEKACHYFKELLKLENYSVRSLKFIVADSSNYYDPLIYALQDTDLDDAYSGFTLNGRYYPGVKEIIEQIKWAKKRDVWGISKNNYESMKKTGITYFKNL